MKKIVLGTLSFFLLGVSELFAQTPPPPPCPICPPDAPMNINNDISILLLSGLVLAYFIITKKAKRKVS